MNKNKLIAYKKSIFNNIIDFFKNIFSRKQASQNEDFTLIDDKDNSFIQNIQVTENKEELRLLQLKQQYENGEIFEEDMSDEDIDELCKIYEKETAELNNDTLRRKNHIAEMLKELKNS